MSQRLLDNDYRVADDERVTQAVLRAIADAEDVDPVDLDTPLNAVVDPEALDALFEPRFGGRPRSTGEITFTYCGYDVSVRDGDHVALSEARG